MPESGEDRSGENPQQQTVPEPVRNDADRDTQEHRAAERRHWCRQNILASVALLASIGAAIEAGLAYLAAQGQLTAMRNEQRPWLRQRFTEIGNLEIAGDDLTFSVMEEIFNAGKSPAIHISQVIELSPNKPEVGDIQKRLCIEADFTSKNSFIPTTFPQETDNFQHQFTFKVQLQKFKINFSGPYNPDPVYYVIPVVVGCISYKFSIDDSFHHTRCAIAFDKKNPADARGLIRINPVPQIISGSDLRAGYSSMGKNDAD